MARPKIIIDYVTVERLASIMCTITEIAAILDISHDTLQRDKRFCVLFKKGQETGKASLRRRQFAMSEKNPTMAIWLGKQYLEQKDESRIEHSGETTVNNKVDLTGFTTEQLKEMLKE